MRQESGAFCYPGRMDIEAELRRVARLLETEIQVAGSSKRAVERRLEVAPGYLTKVIKGGIEFRLRHVLEVAEATGFDVAEFFHKAFPLPPGAAAAGEGAPPAISAAGATGASPAPEGELERRVERAVARRLEPLLAELAELRRALLSSAAAADLADPADPAPRRSRRRAPAPSS